MTTTTRNPRSTVTGRSLGWAIAAVINIVLLYLINVAPGWQVVPFLTDDMRLVLGITNLSLWAGVVHNVVSILWRSYRVRAFGDTVTTAISLAALVRTWQVFPFDFGSASIDWTLLCRIVLAVGIVGTAVGLVVYVVGFVRALASSSDGR